MPRVLPDGKPVERAYQPPVVPARAEPKQQSPALDVVALAAAIVQGMQHAIASMPAPVINVPKSEVKINSPVYVQPTEVKVPATTVNVPETKAPIVNIEPAAVTLQTNRPKEWEFTVTKRNEFGQVVTIRAKAV